MNFKILIVSITILSTCATNMHASSLAGSNTTAASSSKSAGKVYACVNSNTLGALNNIIGKSATTEHWAQGSTSKGLKKIGWTKGHTEFTARELVAYPEYDNGDDSIGEDPSIHYRLGLCLGMCAKGVKVQTEGSIVQSGIGHVTRPTYFQPKTLYKMPMTESKE